MNYTLPTSDTTQTQLADVPFTRDAVGNPTVIQDASATGQWPAHVSPRARQDIRYDGHYRVTDVANQYAVLDHRPPFEHEYAIGDTRPIPATDVATRPQAYSYLYDELGNVTGSWDAEGSPGLFIAQYT